MPSVWVLLGWVLLIAAPLFLFAPITRGSGIGLIQGVAYGFISFVAGFVVLDENQATPSKHVIGIYVDVALGWGVFVIFVQALVWFVNQLPRHQKEVASPDIDCGAIMLDLAWEHPIHAASPVRIAYVDQKGKKSDRVIVPKIIVGKMNGKNLSVTAVRAFCTQAKAPRTFALRGIKEVTDEATGEVMSAKAWAKSLADI